MLVAKLSILCVLLSLGFVQADVTTVLTINQTEFKKPDIQDVHIRNSLMTVVSCNNYSKYEDFLEDFRKCDVSQMAVDNKSKPVSCKFVFNKHLAKGYPLTKNKAVLISLSDYNETEQYVNYTILNFPNCKTTVYKIKADDRETARSNFLDNSNAISINADNTFDILYYDAKACGEQVCRLTLGAQGNKVRGPIAAFTPLVGNSESRRVQRYVKKIPSSSNFILTELNFNYVTGYNNFIVSLIKPEEKMVLKEFKTSGHSAEMIPHDVSASHGVIHLCGRTHNILTVDCDVFDANGKNMSNFEFRAGQWIETVAVENLANDEFLLMLQGEERDSVMKLKSDGSVLGIVNLAHFADAESRLLKYDFEKRIDINNNQYCVTRYGWTPILFISDKSELKFVKECFNDSDFHYSYGNE